MKKLFQNQKFIATIKALQPWAIIILVVLVMRVTGIFSSVSSITQQALIKSGIMDITPNEDIASQFFDYNFTIKDLNENEINVNQFKGKVIFLNMWATWCGPCRAEMPSIQNLYNKVASDSIVFIMLSLDDDNNKHKVVKYIKEKGYTFPIYMPSSALPTSLHVSSIPTTFIIDTEGKIKTKKVGVANYDTQKFQKYLQTLSRASR